MSLALRIGLALLAGMGFAGMDGASHAPRAGEAASAQALLFDAPYLARLDPPATLAYGYRHGTADEDVFGKAFQDTVRVKVGASDKPGGVNTVSLEIFSGARMRTLGPHADMRGNPIIMIFLERDLWEMRRRVGGVPVYYRNRIRRAFREAATVEPVEIVREGERISAHKVTIMPFEDDPNAARLKEFRTKTYEFVVAAAVPGGVHEIRAWVPGPEGRNALIEDRMTFTGAVKDVQR